MTGLVGSPTWRSDTSPSSPIIDHLRVIPDPGEERGGRSGQSRARGVSPLADGLDPLDNFKLSQYGICGAGVQGCFFFFFLSYFKLVVPFLFHRVCLYGFLCVLIFGIVILFSFAFH